MASIQRYEGKRGTTYRVMWRLEDGKQRSKTIKDKDEAKRFRNEVEALEQRQRAPDPQRGSITLSAWSEQFLGTLHLKPKSMESYRSLLRSRILPVLGHKALSAITRLEIQQWIADMADEVSARRTKSAYALLNQMLSEAVRHDLILTNPAADLSLPKVSKRDIDILTLDQLKAVAAQCGRYEPLVLFLGIMGVRWSEAIGLTWDRVNDSTVTIDRALSEVKGVFHEVDTKSYEVRRLPVPAYLMDRLPERSEGYVFTTTQDNPIRSARFRNHVWAPALKTAGVEYVKIHALRHTAASLLISQGAHIKLVQRFLGHANATMTLDIYGHLYGNDLDSIAERMDEALQE